MALLGRFELPTTRLGNEHSIHWIIGAVNDFSKLLMKHQQQRKTIKHQKNILKRFGREFFYNNYYKAYTNIFFLLFDNFGKQIADLFKEFTYTFLLFWAYYLIYFYKFYICFLLLFYKHNGKNRQSKIKLLKKPEWPKAEYFFLRKYFWVVF